MQQMTSAGGVIKCIFAGSLKVSIMCTTAGVDHVTLAHVFKQFSCQLILGSVMHLAKTLQGSIEWQFYTENG